MRFAFTPEQLQFREAVRDLLERECTPDVARGGHAPDLWKKLAEIGVLGLRRDLDEIDLVLPMEETGRSLVPGPIVETAAVAVPAGVEADVVAVGFGGEPVAHADVADVLLLESEGALHAVRPEDVELTPADSLSELRPVFRMAWEPSEDTRLGAADLPFDRAAFGASAQLVGVAGRVIDMAARHASDRHQFGVPIGTFQAVKHLLANALIRLEFARPAVYRAAWSLAHDVPERSRDVSMAKALASDAAVLACRTALQVHGAVGYTEEHDLHLWLKQGWALAFAYGDATWHRERVAGAVLSHGGRENES